MAVLVAVGLPGAAVDGQRTAAGAGAAYRVIALPSGRVIAEARPDILATPVAPGSLMKLVTVVALAESGHEPGQVRLVCARNATVDGVAVPCVHPDLHRPLNAGEALGYSCNAYFAAVSRRLSRPAFDSVLIRLGLPPLPAGTPLQSASLGLAGVRATPAQLLEAFLRLAGSSRHEVPVPAAARRVLRAGMELAARDGTASALSAAGFNGMAKTGTAPMPGGGYAGMVAAIVNTERPTHAVVVVAPGAAGSDAAAIAAELLARHGAPRGQAPVRVGVARPGGGHDITVMGVDEYVSRVVAGEMGGRAAPSALEAMAITVRTFLEANRGRHGSEGFDVCDLTHCQVLGRPDASTAAAARATTGLVLMDSGSPAHVYYSSWCGGHTELPSHAWSSARDVVYLPARPDSACMDGAPWTSEMTEPELRRVLEASGLRGDRIDGLRVMTRHPSGRAAELGITGMVPDRLDANAFRSAAGRLLGWQTVKSTWFEARRSSTGYVLTGRGAGHGVGLCIRGAINRGRQGASRDDILAAYFPGLRPSKAAAQRAGGSMPAARTLRVTLPEGEREARGATRSLAVRLLQDVARRLGLPEPADVELVFHPTVEAYTRATGQPWWTAGRTTGSRVDLLPRAVLASRSILEPTLRHEFTHVLADRTLAGRPLWVREGLAVHLAGEANRTAGRTSAGSAAAAQACPSDASLRSPGSAEAMRRAYDAAGACVARALEAGVAWQDLR